MSEERGQPVPTRLEEILERDGSPRPPWRELEPSLRERLGYGPPPADHLKRCKPRVRLS